MVVVSPRTVASQSPSNAGGWATITGAGRYLREKNPKVHIVAVEPAESSVLLGGEPGPHKIEGVGIGYLPPLWEPSLVDEIVPVGGVDRDERPRPGMTPERVGRFFEAAAAGISFASASSESVGLGEPVSEDRRLARQQGSSEEARATYRRC